MANVAENLQMTHVRGKRKKKLPQPPDTESLKQEAAASLTPPPEPEPREKEQYHFVFEWTDGRGKVWKGDFVNTILAISQQGQAAILESKLLGGQPYDSIPPMQRNLQGAVAWMTFSLVETPSWAEDLRDLKDPFLVLALYEEVASHEAYFFGLHPGTQASKETTGND